VATWVLLVAGSGCGRERALPARAGQEALIPERPAARAAAPGVVRAFVIAAPETIRLFPEQPRPEPTAEYATLESARDRVLALVRRAATAGDTAIHVSTGSARFKYWYLPDSATGYAIHVAVTDTSECPVTEVETALATEGWVQHNGYSADGPDGTVIGYVTERYLCVLEGRWDGGDDSDSTYVPTPGCELTVTCVPRREEDVPKY
jgi:hypothetical protein